MARGFRYEVMDFADGEFRFGVVRKPEREGQATPWETVCRSSRLGFAQGILQAIKDADRMDEVAKGNELVRRPEDFVDPLGD